MAKKYSDFEDYMKTIANREKNPNYGVDIVRVTRPETAPASAPPVEKYHPKLPQDKVITTMDMSPYFFPLLFASEKGPLGIWEKKNAMGHIKRRIEAGYSQRFHVLELINAKNSLGTCIYAPRKDWMSLHVSLPHLVIVVKNLRRNFSFEVQVLDTRGFLRRFNIATWFNPATLTKWPFLCQLPLTLELGWNEIHVDLNDLLWRTYKSSYFEAVRLVINASCRVRQVFFCADNVISGELPIPAMQRFENMKMVKVTFGPLNHPNYTEPGPNHSLDAPYIDPAMIPIPTRVEKDLQHIHTERFKQIKKLQLKEPYRSYFKDLVLKSKSSIASTSQNEVQETEEGETNEGEQIQIKSQGQKTRRPATSPMLPGPGTSGTGYSNSHLHDKMPPYAVPIPVGLTGPISLVQLMRRSMSAYPTARSTPDDNIGIIIPESNEDLPSIENQDSNHNITRL